MKTPLATIPQLYRNVRRWTEIISILSKYGLADWLSRLNVDFVKDQLRSSSGNALARESHEKRVRMAIEELGPTFIKLGQLLSTRPDLIGDALADELVKLQSEVPADDFDYVQKLVETELGQPLDDLFSSFEPTPIASASIGQVHAATLRDGREVVVKIQHDRIGPTVSTDLDILTGMAQLAERLDDLKPYRPVAVVGELARTMRREMEFGREEPNLTQFCQMFEADEKVKIPRPILELSTPRVLAMERLQGTRITETVELQRLGIDRQVMAQRLAEVYLRMIFQEGFFHADPHPGNILVLRGEVLALLDFGMVGRISERTREDIEEMMLAILHQDVPMLTTLIQRVGELPPNLDQRQFANDVAEFVGQYSNVSLSRFDLGDALREMTATIRRHHIMLPAEVALLIKVLITLEGTGRQLSPDLSIIELMRPFRRRIVMRRLSPARHARKVRRIMMQLEQLAEDMPQRLGAIVEQIQSGKFDVHLDHRRLGPSVNRLVMGMLAGAMFLGSSLMLSNKVAPVLFPGHGWLGVQDVSVLGLLGVTASFAMGARLILAIRKSGNLDRPN